MLWAMVLSIIFIQMKFLRPTARGPRSALSQEGLALQDEITMTGRGGVGLCHWEGESGVTVN